MRRGGQPRYRRFVLLALALLSASHIAPADPAVTYKQPQLAVSGETVALVFGSGNAVYFRASHDRGKTFAPPIKVGEAVYLPLGNHRGPRIAVAGKVILISAISAKARGEDGDLVVWRSTDDGQSWSAPHTVNSVTAAAREGLHGMAAGPDGTVFLTWLDLRSKGMQLYGAVSRDAGASWLPDSLVYASPDGEICTCCHPTAAVGYSGELYVMWRNALGGSRDMYFAESNDAGRKWRTQKLGNGTWPLNACPMDGGGFALDSKKAIHTAWRRADTVFEAVPGHPEQALGKGKNPAIAAGVEGSYTIWSDGVALKLKRPGKREPEVLAPEGSFGVLAGSGPVYAAWEEKGAIGFARIE